VKRKIIKIDEKKCNGCGLCIPNCPEGALLIIDGKARLISDLFCDGLGACIGNCPKGAIAIEEREAEKYDEKKVMENIIKAGPNTIKAHLVHLKDHNEVNYLKEAITVLKKKGIKNPLEKEEKVESKMAKKSFCGCPGSSEMDFSADKAGEDESGKRTSQLRQWPVQLHLVSPTASYYAGKDVLLAADCTAYALADFHKDFLKGRSLAIACPKLDSDQEVYEEKIKELIDEAKINTLTVVTMEVPCCYGLLDMAKTAALSCKRKIPIKSIVVGIKGEVKSEEWV
jgi:Pyruvate/2-oxoacid:ferredoxin oxidoreductase delta subunit